MAYLIETTDSNGYRCSCCGRSNTRSYLVDTLEEALQKLPTEFPTEGEFGGRTRVTIKNGGTGKLVAESKVSFAPVWQRGDGYKFTGWSLFIDEEEVPSRGTYIDQIIHGCNRIKENDEEPEPLQLIADRTWSQLCDELQEARRQKDIREAEAQMAEAQKKLNTLRGATS